MYSRADHHFCGLRCVQRCGTDRLEIYQCLFIRIALRTGAFRSSDDDTHQLYGSHPPNAEPRSDDSFVLCLIGMIYGRTHTRDVRLMGGLMKIMPFLAVGYVIAGLANLGLPGLSGFVAEMTVFVGSFQNNDTFHRVCTLIATTSIVITAVYILRVVGKILYGKVLNPTI